MSTDMQGNGDQYDPTASPQEVAAAISRAIGDEFPGTKATVVSRTTSTSWSIEIAVLSSDRDLAASAEAEILLKSLSNVARRHGYDHSDPARDHYENLFRVKAAIHEDYWSNRQNARLESHYQPMNPSRFLKELSKGDRLIDLSAGTSHKVVSISSARFETEAEVPNGRIRWNSPRAAALRISGRIVRIARGNARNPDDHVLLEWITN